MKRPATKNTESTLQSWSDIALPGVQSGVHAKREDLFAVGSIFLYCLLFAVLRLSVSSTMELDESEQFFNGSFFSFGYAHQPPLYSWIVHGISSLSGMNLLPLVVAKYSILFFFYLSFYLIARSFWDTRQSLLVTGSLLLFPTYSYEFNRDLSHTVLITAMASITSYFFIRLLQRKRTADYLLLGASIGLGIISKYNFAFFLAVLIAAAVSFREGRSVLLNRKILLSLAICLFVVSPHVLWLMQNNFLPLRHAFAKAETGTLQLAAPQKVFTIIVSSYSGVVSFLVAFAVLFGFRATRVGNDGEPRLLLFRYLAVYGLTIPIPLIIFLRAGHFSERWLAPFFFSLPIAFFSKINFDRDAVRVKLLGYICILVAVAVLAARCAIGFFPDAAGKVERIHTPFKEVSLALMEELKKRGIEDQRNLTIVAGSEFLAANIRSCLPGSNFLLSGRDAQDMKRTGPPEVLVWEVGENGTGIPEELLRTFPMAVPLGTFTAPYLHAEEFPPYVLGAALIR